MSVSLPRAARLAAVRRPVITAALILTVGFGLGGCSAGHITGFDFPSFGLLKKSDKHDPRLNDAGAPPAGERLGNR